MLTKTNAITDIDPYTGREILRIPASNKINLHTYYSRRAFHPTGKMIAYSALDFAGASRDNRLAPVPGTVYVLSFPDGEPLHAIDDLPVNRHTGNAFEFTPCGRFLAVHLEGAKLGLYDLQAGEMHNVPISGSWESFGGDGTQNIAIVRSDGSLCAARLAESAGALAGEDQFASREDIRRESRYPAEYGAAVEVKMSNVKLSPSGKFCMFVIRCLDASGGMMAKELFLGALDGSFLKSLTGGSVQAGENPERFFHHHAWVRNQDKILYHGFSRTFDRMTFHTYDVSEGATEEIFPAFGAKGHHSIMSASGRYILTDSYSGDLDGVVSIIDLQEKAILPIAAWKLGDHIVDGHPCYSPDEQWILYSCNVNGGSEVRVAYVGNL